MQLSHILWIGGSPCAGKSSITRLLAQQYNLQTYSCDDHYEAHLNRAAPDKHPLMSNAAGMTWNEVWMRPIETLITRELAFYREEFEMVIEDLLALPRTTPIIAEGAALLPECVSPLTPQPGNLHRANRRVPIERIRPARLGSRYPEPMPRSRTSLAKLDGPRRWVRQSSCRGCQSARVARNRGRRHAIY